VQILEQARQSLKSYQARKDDYKIDRWQLSVTDSETLSVGLKDKEIGGVYGPPAARRVVAGSIYVVWHDGQVSRSAVNSLFLRHFEARMKKLRNSAYREEFVIDMPGSQELPGIKIFDDEVKNIVDYDSARCFDMLSRYKTHLTAVKESFDGSFGARKSFLSVVNSKGLDQTVASTVNSFSAGADSVFGVGYRSRRRLTDEELIERLIFLNDWLPHFHNVTDRIPSQGEHNVVLLPGAAASFLGHFVLRNLDGEAVANKNSAWAASDFDQSRQVFNKNLSLRYDPTVDWLSRSYRMDARGLMAENVLYIESGQLMRPVVSLKAAQQLSCVPSPVPSSGALTINSSEQAKLEDYLTELDDGIIVPGVLGMHTQDSSRGNYSLAVPSALIVHNGSIIGRCKATLSGNFFNDLGEDLMTLESKFDDIPGLAVKTKVSF
jgi:PmbA protein